MLSIGNDVWITLLYWISGHFAVTGLKKTEEEPEVNDELAYTAFEEVLNLLHPDVVMVYQCGTADVKNGLARKLCSSVEKSGKMTSFSMRNGHKTAKINSVHPMYFARTDKQEESSKRVMRKYLFHATFIIAANALAGRELSGLGLSNLRTCAIDGPLMSVGPDGPRPSLQRPTDYPVASPEFIERLKELGFGPKVV